MAIVTGTAGQDTIRPGLSSAGVTGLVGSGGDIIYGREGNDQLQGGSSLDGLYGDAGNDWILASPGNDFVDGGQGFDSLDYRAVDPSLFGNPVPALTVTLTAAGSGTASLSGLGSTTFMGIETIYGTAGADSLSGFAGQSSAGTALQLVGGAGNDTIDGANTSWNIASYATSDLGVTVNLGGNTASDGLGGTDTLLNVVRVSGSAHNDTVTGGTGNDWFGWSSGNDTYDGAGGANTLTYSGLGSAILASFGATDYSGTVVKSGAGTDSFSNIQVIQGSSFNDTLIGSAAAAASQPFVIQLRGSGGADLVNGLRSQFNRADYLDSPNAVLVRLQTSLDDSGNWHGYVDDGWLVSSSVPGAYFRDTLTNVVRVVGSNFNDTIYGSDANDRFDGSAGNDYYDSRAGYDTVDYGGMASVIVTAGAAKPGLYGLGTAVVAKTGTGGVAAGTDTIGGASEFRGSSGNDVIYGFSGAYLNAGLRLRGGAGNDTIHGYRNSTNGVDYQNATAAVTIDLQASTDPGTGDWIGIASGNASVGTDRLVNVTRVRASSFDDTIHGGNGNDVIEVLVAGNHTLHGRGGLNEVRYATGNTAAVVIDLGTTASGTGFGGYLGFISKPGGVTDTLYDFSRTQGGGGSDSIYGTPGNDTLAGGAGSNLLDGRGGSNWVTYRPTGAQPASTEGVSINLVAGTATNPWDGTDTLVNIQHAIGTLFDDDIIGRALPDGRSFIRGDGGDDLLRALTPGTLVTADYLSSLSGITADLGTGIVSDDGWFGGGDVLLNIASIRGSGFADSIAGSTRNDHLEGGGGNDTLAGGAGTDIAWFGGSKAQTTLTRKGDGGWTATGPDGTDTLTSIEIARFSDGDVVLGATPSRGMGGGLNNDLLWRHESGGVFLWTLGNGAITSYRELGTVGNDWRIKAAADFDGNGTADLLWQHESGAIYLWRTAGGAATAFDDLGFLSPYWQVQGAADMDGDGRADVLWRGEDGTLYAWGMDGGSIAGQGIAGWASTDWQVTELADFNADGMADILWRHTDGTLWIWLMDGLNMIGQGGAGFTSTEWSVTGTGDFNGDGAADILFSRADGTVYLQLMQGAAILTGTAIAAPGAGWHAELAGDYTADGKADILWRHDTGAVYLWQMDGTTPASGFDLGFADNTWQLV